VKVKVFLLIVAMSLALSLFATIPAHSVSAQTVQATHAEHATKASTNDYVTFQWWDYDHVVSSYYGTCGYEGLYMLPILKVIIPGPYSGWFLYYRGGSGIKQSFGSGSVFSFSSAPPSQPYVLITQLQINC
jgi:hypothetical protein